MRASIQATACQLRSSTAQLTGNDHVALGLEVGLVGHIPRAAVLVDEILDVGEICRVSYHGRC